MRPCSICENEALLPRVNGLMGEGASLQKIADETQCAVSTLWRHRQHYKRTTNQKPRTIIERPQHESSDDDRQRQQKHCEWLASKLAEAESRGADVKEITALANAYTNANKHLSRLNGSFDITEAAILRSVPWKRLQALMLDALKPFPQASVAVIEGLKSYEEIGK